MRDDDRIYARIAWRLIPFLALLFVMNYLDRVNVGFAALTMNPELGFSPSVFGFGAGLLFFAFALFAIPSAVAAEKFGARWWLLATLSVWGLLSAGTAFVRTQTEFYAVRFLLGAAEAGFLPGIVYYLTLWFPPSYRARFMAMFVAAGPLAFILGGSRLRRDSHHPQFRRPLRLAMAVHYRRLADTAAGARRAADPAELAFHRALARDG